MKNRRVVILAGAGDSTNIVFHEMKKHFEVTKVVLEEPIDQLTFLKKRMKKLGAGKVLGQVLFKVLVASSLEKKSQGRLQEIRNKGGLDNSPISKEDILKVTSVNSDECITFLQQTNPAVVIVNGTRIISKKVLDCVSAYFINMHAGITPLYRGVHGGYWALANQDKENCGVTVHLVDAGIDTGNILYQRRINPEPSDNFITYPLLQLQAGLPLLKQAVQDALNDRIKILPNPEGKSILWSHPTIGEYLTTKFKLKIH